jgi:hypothetical protein
MDSLILPIISEEKRKQDEHDYKWFGSRFQILNELKPNNVGNVGEKYIKIICNSCGIQSNINGGETKQVGGGNGDGTINNKNVEIKTARQGFSDTFQHELGEHPWKSDFLIFVDITPSNIYLTIIPNFSRVYYEKPKRKATPYFNKTITRRKETNIIHGAFKLTLSEKDLKECENTLEISLETDIECISNFIYSIIF